jgi:hypothetical protein
MVIGRDGKAAANFTSVSAEASFTTGDIAGIHGQPAGTAAEPSPG